MWLWHSQFQFAMSLWACSPAWYRTCHVIEARIVWQGMTLTALASFSRGCHPPSHESEAFWFVRRLSRPTDFPLGPSRFEIAGWLIWEVLVFSFPPKANLGPLSARFVDVSLGLCCAWEGVLGVEGVWLAGSFPMMAPANWYLADHWICFHQSSIDTTNNAGKFLTHGGKWRTAVIRLRKSVGQISTVNA